MTHVGSVHFGPIMVLFLTQMFVFRVWFENTTTFYCQEAKIRRSKSATSFSSSAQPNPNHEANFGEKATQTFQYLQLPNELVRKNIQVYCSVFKNKSINK